jgi:HAD superfamily hydrolase (TIGR01509 family)
MISKAISNKRQLIIFDCDGVLIDSEIIAASVESEMAAELGYEITPLEICIRFAGKPARLVWETFCQELDIEFTEEFYQNAHNRVHEAFLNELKIVDGIFEVFEKLEMPFCVASTTRIDSLIKNLKLVDLHKYLEPNIFSASQVARPKPFPDVFLHAAKTMGYEPQDCLVFEDSIAGVNAAIAANMRVIGFVGGSHIDEKHSQRLVDNGAFDILKSHNDFFKNLEYWLEKN